MLKLSFIIPIYKVEPYLFKCISSCLDQDVSYDTYELILVNDGSPDNSIKIAQDFVLKYPNVSLFSQPNQGLSVARNNGLKQASGEFVWFVDSDDWIEPNCLGRIYAQLTEQLDILQLQFRYVYDDTSKNIDAGPYLVDGIKSGEFAFLNYNFPTPAQFCIYRRDFLESRNLLFVPGLIYEDSEFKPRALFEANYVASDDVVSYNYYQRESGSITSSFSLRNAMCIIQVCNSLFVFSKKLTPMLRRRFNDRIALSLNTLFSRFSYLSMSEKEEVGITLLNNTHLFYCMRDSLRLKYRFEGHVICISIRLFLYLLKALR